MSMKTLAIICTVTSLGCSISALEERNMFAALGWVSACLLWIGKWIDEEIKEKRNDSHVRRLGE